MQRKAEMWHGDRRGRGKERHKEIIDDDGYETFSYEYKSHSLKKPSDSGDMPRRHSGCRHERVSPHYKQYSPEHTERVYSDQRGDERRRSRRKASLQARSSRDPHFRDRVTLHQAATKIQAAFRGYLSRKEFWKKREQYWRKQRLANSHRYMQDEIILPSESVSTINEMYLSGLATNADPNLGLTAPLPTLDSSEKNYILRELKSKQKFSDDVTSVNQLQTETSPTVILFGGINPPQAKDYFLGSAMLVYNVRKDKYYFAGTMPEPRNYHGAVYLNGKVYITGGYSPLHVIHGQMLSTQTTFQLTVRSKRWRRRADMHQARACHGTCVVDENIMVFGGRDASGKLLSTVEVYYPKRDQWILAKPMPEAIMGMSVAVLDGCVWIVGGIINEGHSSRYTVSNHVYTFDTQQQRYYRKILLPEPRAFSCAASLKHELWVWCGLKDALNEEGLPISTNTVYVYNPEITNWEQHAAIGTPKHAAAAAKFGRRVYLFGGMSSISGSKEVLNENDHYNRENDKYFEGASLPSPLTGSAAIALPIDYIATSDPKWNFENLDESAYNEAATKIQAAYRGYRTRSLMSNHKLLMYSSDADLITKNNRMHSYQNSANGSYSDKWKLFQRVQIDDWPPVPDPRSSSSELNVQLGTLPPGYTVTASNSKTKVKRYVPLPEHCDPNLAMCGHLCNVYKKTRNVLGLRKVEHMPSFAKNMLTVTTLQDDSLPVVLVMGGLQPRDPVNLSYGKLIMRYHPLKNRWEYFGVLPEPRNYHAAVYYQEFIYVTGGCDPDKRNSGEMVSTNTTYCLNIHSSEWTQKADMNCYRAHHCLIVAHGKLFAVGGRNNNGRLVASIEAYDIENDKWTLLRPMSVPRMSMACAFMDDHIWCLGGLGLSDSKNNITYPVLSSVISYDVFKDEWISRPPLRCPRAFASCVVIDNVMWLVGGASKDKDTNCLISMGSVDKYVPSDARWVRQTVMNNPRHCAAVVPIESCIYVFGGVSSQQWSPLSKNEMIVTKDTSLHSCQELPVPLCGLAAVAIPPALPSLRSASVASLLHAQLTFH